MVNLSKKVLKNIFADEAEDMSSKNKFVLSPNQGQL